MTARRKKKRTHAQNQEADLLERLLSALSEDEVCRVLPAALLELDEAGRERLFGRLGGDTGSTLRAALETGKGHMLAPGKGKVREDWDKAWRDWHEIVAESGSENGRFTEQEDDWEQPYLDTYSVMRDLEQVAAQIRPLVARIQDEDLAPGFDFPSALRETAEEIGAGLPEWFGDDHELDFGPEVTGCLIEWERRSAAREGRGVFDVVNVICEVDLDVKGALDGTAITEFILGLSDEEQQEILSGIHEAREEPEWSSSLDSTHSVWFQVHQKLASKWKPELFTATSRAHVRNDWKLALPLLQDLLRRKDFAEAKTLAVEAVHSLLGLMDGEHWDPRDGLLIEHPRSRFWRDENEPRARLVRAWCTAAKGLGELDLAAVLELQAILLDNWQDWDVAVAAFRELPKDATARRLFEGWQTRVADQCISFHVPGRSDPLATQWMRDLAEAALADDGQVFHRSVRRWLGAIGRRAETLRTCLRSLGMLTLDVDSCSKGGRAPPRLRRLLAREDGRKDESTPSRRRWVGRFDGGALLPEVLQLWTHNAARLVPDPTLAAKSCYDECADWMGVTFELDRSAYDRILGRWKAKHPRRRNLWAAMREQGLPV